MKTRPNMTTSIGTLCLAVLTTGATGWAQEERDVRVVIKKHVECDGADCASHGVFIDENGATTEIGGDGHVWVSADGDEAANIRVVKVGEGNRIFFGDGAELEFGGKGGYLGVQLSELTDQLRAHFGVPDGEGVLVSEVVADSPAEVAGLQAGDVVTGINGEPVGSTRDLARSVRALEASESAALEVWRDGALQTVTAQVEQRALGGDRHGAMIHRIIECEDGEDCAADLGQVIELHALGDGAETFEFHSLDTSGLCGDGDECEVQVQCEVGDDGERDCECTVNGETADCEQLHEG